MAFKVVRTSPPLGEVPYWDELMAKIGAEFIKEHCPTEDQITALAKDADAVISLFEPFTKKVIDSLPKLRLISQIGIGYDLVDVDAATQAGVIVANTPDYCLEEVSDHTMALLLACARKITRINNVVKQGQWHEGRVFTSPQFKLRGQTLGLVGFGQIARTVVRKAQGFGLRVIAFDPYASEASTQGHYVELVDLDTLLQESDYVSAHAPLTKENRHMFTLDQFKKMKPTAFFINTARGGLVDEQALYSAITEGYIAGAALDVLEAEPPAPDNPLLKLDSIIITAHTAQASDTAMTELMRRPGEEVVRVLEGQWPRGFVNPQVKETYVQRFGPMKG